MAAHANRFPSPGASRPINPSLRNSESNPAMRRSFSGKPSVLTNPRRFDPSTPANSPSDFAGRHSVDSYPKEKENYEKDNTLKPLKFHPSAKGSKNFMSPTISAASKFSPSPKKKVLVERNDPVRTSFTLSDGKATFYSTTMSSNASESLESKIRNPKTEMWHDNGQRIESSLDFNPENLERKHAVQEGTRVSKPLKKVSFSDVLVDAQTELSSESVITESECPKLESNLNNDVSCSLDSSSIAPLDADPSLPPYDPKTNYLSPRPQFLHYKPNPRVKILLNKERGLDAEELKKLEDSLLAEILSESFSESEGAEENEDLQKEELDVVSADMVIGVDEVIEDNLGASESSESLPTAVSEENSVKEKAKKPWSVLRLVVWILMLLVACGSVLVFHSPALDEIALKELTFSDMSKLYHQSKLAASAKRNYYRLVQHFNQFSVDSVSFIFNLVNDLGKGENTASLQYLNISDLQTNVWSGEAFLNKKAEELVEDVEEDDDEFEGDADIKKYVDSNEEFNTQEVEEVLEISERDFDGDDVLEEVGDIKKNVDLVIDTDDNMEKEFDTGDNVLEAKNVCHDCASVAESESENSKNIENQSSVVDASMDGQGVISQVQDSELEVAASDTAEIEKSHDGSELDSSRASLDQKIRSDAESLSEAIQSSLPTELPPTKDKFLVRYVMGLSALVTSLFAVAVAYTYHHRRNPGMPNVVQENPLKLSTSRKHDIHQNTKMTYSKNWQRREMDESCPSEVSCFQNTAASASNSRREARGVSEAESTERKIRNYSKRGESLTSSDYSAGSPSYGSFTTFERIPIKNANGDEEVITPVRRSSRIRNHHHQVTSP